MPSASMASPKLVPVGLIAGSIGSWSCATTVPSTRSRSVRERARRSQPRTVASGTPSRCAIGRWPAPPAWAINAEPMTSMVSLRLGRLQFASSTVVTPQDRQRARRGRRQRNCPPKPRRERVRACPHGASEEPQPHRNRPARSAASTIVGSPFTTFVTLGSSFHGSYRRSAGLGAEGATRVAHWPPRPGQCNPGHRAADRGRTDQQPGRTNSVIVDEHQPCSPSMTPTTLPIPIQQDALQSGITGAVALEPRLSPVPAGGALRCCTTISA